LIDMASDAPALPRPASPSDQIARWLDHFRARINLGAVDSIARKPVRILVGGPRAPEMIVALDPELGPRSLVLERADGNGPIDSDVRAFVYCRAVDDPPTPVPPPYAGSPLPVFIAEYEIDRVAAAPPIATSGPEKKPVPGRPGLYRLSELSHTEMRKHLLHDLVITYDGLEVALGASLPVFRPTVAAKLTLDCAVTCLKVAGASALADHVPLLGFLLGGIASAGDTIAITGFQIDMLLKIAAAYGKRPEFARIVELLPVIGGGYGWRTLARELSGFIPVAGIAIKAGIAYAGTLVVGQAAAHYYEHGKPLATDKISALYYDALERAKKLVTDMIDRASRRKK
jgi:uncharacterized protein (DUF697 family)